MIKLASRSLSGFLPGILASVAFIGAAQPEQAVAHSGHNHGAASPSHNPAQAKEASVPPLNPHTVCGRADALYETQSACYGLYADTVTDYAKAAAAPYIGLEGLDAVAAALSNRNPGADVTIDPEKGTVTSRLRNADGKLHNPQGPAFIKITPAEQAYMEMRQIEGNFYSTPDEPSFVVYTEGKEARVQWDGPDGTHNLAGPAFAKVDLENGKMILDWAVNGVATSLDCEIGLTSARINLETNIAYFRETASGSVADMQRRMHRNDGLHVRRVNPQTAEDEYRIYRYHGDAADSDEITIEYFHDAGQGQPPREVWAVNGKEIPKIENYTPPVMTHHGRTHCIGNPMNHSAAGQKPISMDHGTMGHGPAAGHHYSSEP